MLAFASTFTISRAPRLQGETGCPIDLQIAWRGKRGDRDTWALMSGPEVWDIEAATWVDEPSPSGRDEAFLRRTRFTSLADAFAEAFAQRDLATELGWNEYWGRHAPPGR